MDDNNRKHFGPGFLGAFSTDQHFHDYVLREYCGCGAYGEVWQAEDISGRRLAIKVVSKKVYGSGWQREFNGIKNYCRTISSHPNLIQILHVGEDEQYFFYTMELADNLASPGRPYYADTLADRIAMHGPLPSDQLVTLTQSLLEGIGTLHQAGLIHRDIKPANIIFINGIPKLSDIGFVAQHAANMSLAGTVGFIPPEELTGGSNSSADKNCQYDIYALGKVMYCALTGLPADEFPFLPGSISFKLSKRLNQVICMACCKNPDERIDSIDEFKKLLSMAVNGDEELSTRPTETKKSITGKLFLAAVATTVIAGLVWHIAQKKWTESSELQKLTSTLSGYQSTPQPTAIIKAPTPPIQPAQLATTESKPEKKKASTISPVQQKTSQTTSVSETKNLNRTIPELNLQLIYIEPGTFMMGSNNATNREKPVHRVTITRNYWIGKYEVTQQEYQKIMGNNPSAVKGNRLPVECVSWNEAVVFCDKLTEIERRAGRLPDGYVYRLPTLAESEFAAKGGNKSKGLEYCGSNDINDVSWWADNSGKRTHDVGTKLPNELGIYDMGGNVWEWCYDRFGGYNTNDAVDPVGPESGRNRSFHGGSRGNTYLSSCQPASRHCDPPDCKSSSIGFRVVLATPIPGTVFDGKPPIIPTPQPAKVAVGPIKDKTWSVPELNMQLVYIEPGTFMMGGKNRHKVTISRSFWIGKHEVTQQEYQRIMNDNPSSNKADKLPVECVTWNEAADLCKKLTLQENNAGRLPANYVYRLPTQAEWEYAARGGNKGKNYLYSGSHEINAVAWNQNNSDKRPHNVGTKLPNELGIYDMSGNVWEWCLDLYGSYSEIDAIDPSGPISGSKYIQRGGSWDSTFNCKIHGTNPLAPYTRRPIVGFRVVLAAPIPGTVFDGTTPIIPVPQSVSKVAGPEKNETWSVPELNLELPYIKPGSFTMGSLPAELMWATGSEGKAKASKLKISDSGHNNVEIQDEFWMGRTKITVGQWRKFVEATGYRTDAETRGVASCFDWEKHLKWMWMPGKNWRDPNYSYPLQDNFPVTCISWNDATAFCKWLTQKERQAGRLQAKLEYRLPAEDEWEYACRGGKTGTKFWWGDNWSDAIGRLNFSGSDQFPNGKSFLVNYEKEDNWEFASPVDIYGEKGRNGFNLADMLGNTWEWCLDEEDDNKNTANRVLRGGAFDSPPGELRCASRIIENRSEPCAKYGFRIICGATQNQAEYASLVKTTNVFPVWFYNGHYYRLFNESESWNKAKKRCSAMGGRLVTIESPGENSFLYDNIKNINGVIFIGATDEEKTGEWRWANSGKPLKFSRWDTGQTFNDGNNKNYAAFCPATRKDRWLSHNGTADNNQTPGEKIYGFICEWSKAEPANKSLPVSAIAENKDNTTTALNNIIIKISTSRKKNADAKNVTLYAKPNGISSKYILCQNKYMRRGRSNIFILPLPEDISTIGAITIEAEIKDNWEPGSLSFELPDKTTWTFTGPMAFGSNKEKIIKYNVQPSITFYFTGLKAGTIQTSNPYINKLPDWASQVKGVCAIRPPEINQPVPVATPQSSRQPATAKPVATQAVNSLFMRTERRKMFMARQGLDRKRYSETEMAEIEDLYQFSSKNTYSQERQDSLKKLIAKYPQANRTGCALLYLGQTCPDRSQAETYLLEAIANHGDCWYGDGVQVGAYARFYLAEYYRQAGKIQEADKLYQEIRDNYPNAVTHNGKSLLNNSPVK